MLLQESIQENKRSLHRHEQAREIIRTVGMATQKSLEYHISDITSLALEAVFNDPYELKVDFVQRRNKTECDLMFVRDENEIDPLTASGVGAVDVASFALRVASWSMARPRTRNVMILDEPFKHLKGKDANQRVLDMMNEISKKLNIQMIMISDERIPREDIIASADRVFEVSIKNGKSKVEVI
jgi:DNA repair exonuclease SbcCD ATPase subunit